MRSDGFTIIELLISSFVFLLLLAAVGGLLTTLTRGYGVVEERSRVLQDSESAIQLLRHEVALAGYRGLGDGAATRSFTLGAPETVVVEQGGGGPPGDTLTVRYFEDRYLQSGDSGERSVEFFATESGSLARCERSPSRPTCLTTELLVGGVSEFRVLDIVADNRDRVTIDEIVQWDPASEIADPRPGRIEGVNVRIVFANNAGVSDFMVGLANPQLYSVQEME